MPKETVDIQVSNIEADLVKLGEGQQTNQIKACLFNLIIYSHDPRRAAYLHQIVQAILEKFPCRIIFIQAHNNNGEEYLRSSVSNVVIGEGDVSISCDQINIDVTTKQLYRVPFVLLPILVPDLPIYLVWGQNPATDQIILPVLQKYASRLIFDAECADDLQQFSQNILNLLETTKMEIRDVKWAAVGGWREVVAHLFNTPEKVHALQFCKELEITYNSHESVFVHHTEVQPIYLQAWLAAQLEWKFQGLKPLKKGVHLHYQSGSDEVHVKLVPEDKPNLDAGIILAVKVKGSNGSSCIIHRRDDHPSVIVHIETEEQCEMPLILPLSELTNSIAFMTELIYRKTSTHYRNMLNMIAQINCQECTTCDKNS